MKTDAKLFIVASPPYRALYKNIIPLYEERVQSNEKWPGYFTHLKELVDSQYSAYVPNTLHFLDDCVLTRELERAGFIVEKAAMYARQDLPSWTLWDGREGVVVIARKP